MNPSFTCETSWRRWWRDGVMGPVGILEIPMTFQGQRQVQDVRVHVNDAIFKGPGKANIQCRHHCSLHRHFPLEPNRNLGRKPLIWHWWVENEIAIWIFRWRLMLGRWFISPLNMFPFKGSFQGRHSIIFVSFLGVDKYVVNLCDSGIPIWCEFKGTPTIPPPLQK